VALDWLLARSPVCVPLAGTVDPIQFEEDLAALELELTPLEIDQLTAER
jgi:aryl-alcohol dehydrogenase-like predicted oxidoreductase